MFLFEYRPSDLERLPLCSVKGVMSHISKLCRDGTNLVISVVLSFMSRL
jgi:hypothetical protein